MTYGQKNIKLCRGKFNSNKLMRKRSGPFLVFLTYLYRDARFRDCKDEQVAYHEGLSLVKMFCDQLCTEDGILTTGLPRFNYS
jgi:hypothetical protein